MKDIKELAQELSKLTENGISGMSNAEVKEHRKAILALNKQCSKALADTSQKDHNYDSALVMSYIQEILKDGYNLVETKLSANQSLIDAQKLGRFKAMIKACVQQSEFSSSKFKIKELSYQRTEIEQSNTLHELRQNVKAMIGPLKMYREHTKEPEPTEYVLTTEDQLIVEVEQLKRELAEKNRIIAEITNLYDQPLLEYKTKLDTIKAIADFKTTHNCSDEEACKVFNISRATLKRMRAEVKEVSANSLDGESS